MSKVSGRLFMYAVTITQAAERIPVLEAKIAKLHPYCIYDNQEKPVLESDLRNAKETVKNTKILLAESTDLSPEQIIEMAKTHGIA